MANYQNILRQAHQAIADVADNADSWRAFLRSAAYTTHYAFPNQALIYSQRPGATMLADIDTWNRAAGRWVNRGAHGVASLGTGNMAGNVRYLFDIKDTHPAGKDSKPLGWQITDANRYPTLQALQEKHNAESLPEIFGLQAALFVAQHGKQLDADLQNAVIGSTLEWAKPQEQTAIFANLITQSAVYMAAVRCGLGDSAVPQDAFADIDRFDTESAVLALGNAVNRAGRQMFAEIGAVVKSIDSVAKTQPKQYDENVSKTNQQEVQDHGYDESERVSGAQDGNEGSAQTAGRENRSAAGEVPAREPLPAVRQDAAGRDAVQRPETDRAALLGAGGADHHEAAGQQPGTGQEQRPVGLDGAHEQSASAGSGTGDAHRDEPVNTEPQAAESESSPSAVSVSDAQDLPESVGRGNLAEETAAAIGLPAPEQQQETIRQLQPRASWQQPIKDDGTHIDEQDIVDVLVMGSGFCEGRFRIQEFFSATVLPTVKEQANWLKKEYGIGGRTWDFRDGERGFLDYDAKGLRIKRYASDNAPDYFRLLPWNEVARRLHLLVHNDQYLDENNKQGYEKWEAEQQAKRNARQAEIDYAEKTIADFCEREGLGEPDFSNLTHIDLAYSTTGDGEHEIQVYANFLRNEALQNVIDRNAQLAKEIYQAQYLAKEAQYNSLCSQIRPHFLYNTLNTISLLIKCEEYDTAIRAIESFSAFLGGVMNVSKDISLQKELDICQAYLKLVQLRYQDRLQYDISVSAELCSEQIPSLTIQPLIENAIKYACEQNRGQTVIHIVSCVSQDRYSIQVSDNGPGIKPETLESLQQRISTPSHDEAEPAHVGNIGLVNIAKRLRLKYGNSASLDILSSDSGTTVSISLPFTKNEVTQ